MIGKLNRKVVITSYSAASTDAYGGLSATTYEQREVWANVENKGGRMFKNDGSSRDWQYDYKITTRHSEKTSEGDTISYGYKNMVVRSIEVMKEGNARFDIIRCSITGSSTI